MPGFGPVGSAPVGAYLFGVSEFECAFNPTCEFAARPIVLTPGFAWSRPASTNDDGWLEYNSTVPTTMSFSGALKLGLTDVNHIYHTFIRFASVPISEGAVIDQANVILTASNSIALTTPLVIVADDTKFSTQLTTVGDRAGRNVTTAAVSWSLTAVTPGAYVYSSDITSVMQELVNRTDWLDPNAHAISVFIETDAAATPGVKEFYSYDQSATLCPQLIVTWTGKCLVGTPMEGTATMTASGYTVGVTQFVGNATLDGSPNMDYRVTQNLLATAALDYLGTVSETEASFTPESELLADPVIQRQIIVPTPSGMVENSELSIARNKVSDGGMESYSVVRTSHVSSVTPMQFGDPVFSLGELKVSYDSGKTLSFKELGALSYGQPTYNLEDRVLVRMDLGFGTETFFRGRIKRTNRVGENSGESIEYEAVGIPNLSDEVELLGPAGDGYYVGDFTLPTTLTIEPGNPTIGLYSEPKLLINAVSALFTGMSSKLAEFDVPSNVDLTGIDPQAIVEAETRLSGGFYSALKNLIRVDPGLKVWFDDTDETWKFIRTMDAPVLNIQIQDSYLMGHNWSEDSSDRYTAVVLIASGDQFEVNFPNNTTAIRKGWTQASEDAWHIQKNSKTGFPAHAAGGDDELSEEEKVWREWILLEPLGAIKSGMKCKIRYRLRNARWASVDAEIIPPSPSAVSVQTGSISTAQPFARVRTGTPLLYQGGNAWYAGGARGPDVEDMYVTYYVTIPIPDTFTIRYPAIGFAGDAYTRYGLRRLKVINVGPADLTSANARRQHRMFSDIRMTCSLPIYGDPMRDMLRFLTGRLALTDIYGVTGLESSKALVMGYNYNFEDNIGTIDVSSDLTSFINNLSDSK